MRKPSLSCPVAVPASGKHNEHSPLELCSSFASPKCHCDNCCYWQLSLTILRLATFKSV